MCSNYQPVTRMDRLLTFFGVEREKDSPPGDVFPLGMAPFIRLAVEGQEAGQPALVVEDGMFGLLPTFAAEMKYGRRTYNARSETVATLASFKRAWSKGQRCVIPTEAFFEPNWETGKAVRWRISQTSDVPMGIAGIYNRWKNPQGGDMFTFTMLTVNADAHPLMKRFHKPADEKRMVVILDRSEYLPWLCCPLEEAPIYFRQWMGHLDAVPAPLARATRAASLPPPQDELF
jgi:putative SOS response-associated peptidase YedK